MPISIPPIQFIYGVALFFAALIVIWIYSRLKPATPETILGYYQIHILGMGEELCGLLTTAYDTIKQDFLEILAEGLGLDLKSLLDVLSQFHVYAMKEEERRLQARKTLILSTANIAPGQPYCDQTDATFHFPFGWKANIRVFAEGRDFGMMGEWNVVAIAPLNLASGKIKEANWSALQKVGELVAAVRPAALNIDRTIKAEERIRAMEKELIEAQQKLAEAEEEKALAMDAATRPSLETSALPTIPRARTAIRTGDLFYYFAAAAIMAF
ncbi:MAG: hypothetical protein QXS76_00365, partial [Candidatus Bathyarchaeia archaeon]